MVEQEPGNNGGKDYFKAKIDHHVRNFDASAARYRRTYFITSILNVVLSGLITIAAGWKPDIEGAGNVILVLGVLVGLNSGWGMFFSPQQSWLICASTSNRLKSLRLRLEATQWLPDAKEEIDGVYQTLQQILDEHNKDWLNIRSALRKRDKPI